MSALSNLITKWAKAAVQAVIKTDKSQQQNQQQTNNQQTQTTQTNKATEPKVKISTQDPSLNLPDVSKVQNQPLTKREEEELKKVRINEEKKLFPNKAVSYGISAPYRDWQKESSSLIETVGKWILDFGLWLWNIIYNTTQNRYWEKRNRTQKALDLMWRVEEIDEQIAGKQLERDSLPENQKELRNTQIKDLEDKKKLYEDEIETLLNKPKFDRREIIDKWAAPMTPEDIQKHSESSFDSYLRNKVFKWAAKLFLPDSMKNIFDDRDTTSDSQKNSNEVYRNNIFWISRKTTNDENFEIQTQEWEFKKLWDLREELKEDTRTALKDAYKNIKDKNNKNNQEDIITIMKNLEEDPYYYVRWQWLEWFNYNVRNDILQRITPKQWFLSNRESWGNIFFSEADAPMIVSALMSDDSWNALQNMYNFIKKYESRVEDWTPTQKEVVNQDRAKKAYEAVIDDLEQYEYDVAWLYDNYFNYDWMWDLLQKAYYDNHWKRVFSHSDITKDDSYYNKDITLEDFATAAVHRLDMAEARESSDRHMIEYEKNPTDYNSAKSYYYDARALVRSIPAVWNRFVDLMQYSLLNRDRAFFQWTYNYLLSLWDNARDDLWFKQELIDSQKVQWWMESMARVREMVTWIRSFPNTFMWDLWELFTVNRSPLADAAPDIAAQASMLAAQEALIWLAVPTEANILANSNKYAKLKNITRSLDELSTVDYLKVKMWDFALRSIWENYVQWLTMAWEFSEWYTSTDFALDTIFWVLDAGMLLREYRQWKEVIKQNFRNDRRADYYKNTFDISDAKWDSLTKEQQIALWWKMRRLINEGIDDLAKRTGKNADEVIEWLMKDRSLMKESFDEHMVQQLEEIRVAWNQAYDDVLEFSLYKAKATDNVTPWVLPEDIVKKIEFKEVTLADWGITKVLQWKEIPTSDEIKTILRLPSSRWVQKEITDLTKNWYQSWISRRQEENYRKLMSWEMLEDYNTVEDMRAREATLKAQRNQMLQLVNKNERNLFLQREYVRHHKPHELFWDTSWSFISAKDPNKEFKNRLKQYSKEKQDFLRELEDIDDTIFVDIDYWDTFYTMNTLSWKPNLVGIWYNNALEINPDLKFAWEDFYRNIMFNSHYSNIEKNAILRSVVWKDKRTLKIWNTPNHVYWSLQEQSYFLWWPYKWWSVMLPSWKESFYRIIPNQKNSQQFSIVIYSPSKNRKRLILSLDKWSIRFRSASEAKEFWWRFTFTSNFNQTYWTKFDVYNWYRDTIKWEEVIVRDWTSFLPSDIELKEWQVWMLEKIQNNLSAWFEMTWRKDARISEMNINNIAAWKDMSKFVESYDVWWYKQMVEEFWVTVPKSYYVYIKLQVQTWKISKVQWASMILAASTTNIIDEWNRFLINSTSKFTKQMQDFVFTNNPNWWTIWIKTQILNEQDWMFYFKYVYREGTDWLYDLYDWQNINVWVMWVNTSPESWKVLIKLDWVNWWQPFFADNMYVLKEDVDSIELWMNPKSSTMSNEEIKQYMLSKRSRESEEIDRLMWWEISPDDLSPTPTLSENEEFIDVITRNQSSRKKQYNKDISFDDHDLLWTLTYLKETSITNNLLWWSNEQITRVWIEHVLINKMFKKITKESWTIDYFKTFKNLEEALSSPNIKYTNWKVYAVLSPESVWLSINYMPESQMLTIKVKDKKMPEWRYVSINWVWDYDVLIDSWWRYLEFYDWNSFFLIKLDSTLKQVQKNINTNLLRTTKEELRWTNATYIVDWSMETIYNFAPYFYRNMDSVWMIDAWDLLDTMVKKAQNDKLTRAILWKSEYTNVELLNAYVIADGARRWVIQEVMWETWLSEEVVSNLYMKVYNKYRVPWELKRMKDPFVKQRMINVLTLETEALEMTQEVYIYAQERIKFMRYKEFVEQYNNWFFEKWLDTTTIEWQQEFMKRMQSKRNEVFKPVRQEDIRNEFNKLRKKSNTTRDAAKYSRLLSAKEIKAIVDWAYEYWFYTKIVNNVINQVENYINWTVKIPDAIYKLDPEKKQLAINFFNWEFNDANIVEFFTSIWAKTSNELKLYVLSAVEWNDLITFHWKLINLNKAMLDSENYYALARLNQSQNAVNVNPTKRYNDAVNNIADTQEQIIKAEDFQALALQDVYRNSDRIKRDMIEEAESWWTSEKSSATPWTVKAIKQQFTDWYNRTLEKQKIENKSMWNKQIKVYEWEDDAFITMFWNDAKRSWISDAESWWPIFAMTKEYVTDKMVHNPYINNFIQTPTWLWVVLYSLNNWYALPQKIIDAIEVWYWIFVIWKTYDELFDEIITIAKYNNKDNIVKSSKNWNKIYYYWDHTTNQMYQDILFNWDASDVNKYLNKNERSSSSQIRLVTDKMRSQSDEIQKIHWLNYNWSSEYNIAKNNAMQNWAIYNRTWNSSFLTKHEFDVLKDMWQDDLLKIISDPNYTWSKDLRYVNIPLANSYKWSWDLWAIEKHIVKNWFDANDFINRMWRKRNEVMQSLDEINNSIQEKMLRMQNATDTWKEVLKKEISDLTFERTLVEDQLEVWLDSNYYKAQKSFFWDNNIVALSYWKTDDLKWLVNKAIKDSQWADEIVLRWWDSIQNINLAKALEDTWEFQILNKSSRWDFLNWWFDKEIHLSKIDWADVDWKIIDNESLIDNLVERSLCNLWI